MYIVIFNLGSRVPEILTNYKGFVEEFGTVESAKEEAEKWIDDKQYRNFKIYDESL